jgi:hypothetical protein
LKELRHALNLVEDHKSILVPREVTDGIPQPLAIRRRLEVEVYAVVRLRYAMGQRRLAHLPAAEQGYSREGVERAIDRVGQGCATNLWVVATPIGTPL